MPKLPALPYARSGVSQGLTANAAYKLYQQTAESQGLQGTRRQDFLRLYSETRALRGVAAQAVQAPKDTIPESNLIVRRGTVQAQGYGQWVGIYQRTVGTSDYYHTPFLVKSSQPLTPAEAEAQALSYLDQQPEKYNRTTLGVQYLGTERFVPTT